MRLASSIGVLAILAVVPTATLAQDAPRFFSETYPSQALGPAMAWYGSLRGEDAALDAKTRELIALGVAAQIPCDYCVYAHRKGAEAAGASEAEIREAVATAAAIRNWSTVLNGMAYDFESFKEEVDQMGTPSN